MYVHEFALLIAIASPIAALCSIHGLWAAGERTPGFPCRATRDPVGNSRAAPVPTIRRTTRTSGWRRAQRANPGLGPCFPHFVAFRWRPRVAP
jgi:hypothetical protein